MKSTVDGLVSELTDIRSYISIEDAARSGDIKSKLMNGLDAWQLASQFIYESFGVAKGLISVYIKQFEQIDGTKSSAQKTLLLHTLNSVTMSSNNAQAQLNKTLSELNAAIEKTAELQAPYKNKSDEKSEFINRVCDRLRDTINKIYTDTNGANRVLKDKTEIVEEFRSKIEKAAPMATANVDAQLQDAVIQSAQKLIDDYLKYAQHRRESKD